MHAGLIEIERQLIARANAEKGMFDITHDCGRMNVSVPGEKVHVPDGPETDTKIALAFQNLCERRLVEGDGIRYRVI